MKTVQFDIREWIASTALLTPTERGVYMDLITQYFMSERSITKDELTRMTRAYEPHDLEALRYVLQTYFELENGAYHSRRSGFSK